jgi:NTE family protein
MSDCGSTLPERVVLVLQGGGALGAFQLGVAEALTEAGIQPDWIVGTSIGALNGAILAGNPPDRRIERLAAFWDGMARSSVADAWGWLPAAASAWRRMEAMTAGVPGLYGPRFGVGGAAYDTAPMRRSLDALLDIECLNAGAPRLTVGAVSVTRGRMRYFDTASQRIDVDHIMASAAIAPAFPAVEVDGDFYWDGGLYSNTPIEAVFSDSRRRSAVIFAVQLWQPDGVLPGDIASAMERVREIRFASRAAANIEHQAELHHLRHIVRELERRMPEQLREDPEVKALAAYGCATTMHVIRLIAPPLSGHAGLKDLDFSRAGIDERRQAGREAVMRMIQRAPWQDAVDPTIGVAVHDDHAHA